MVDREMSLEKFFETRHAKLSMYVVRLEPNSDYPRDDANFRELLRQHFVYWWELEEQKKLLGAGPLNVGTPEQVGMAILLASSQEEAERMAQAEPMHRAGATNNKVIPWQLNEGAAVSIVQDWIAAN